MLNSGVDQCMGTTAHQDVQEPQTRLSNTRTRRRVPGDQSCWCNMAISKLWQRDREIERRADVSWKTLKVFLELQSWEKLRIR